MSKEALRRAVVERDYYLCQDCGQFTTNVHHICPLSRFGKNEKWRCWQMKNMITLCPTCHIPGAHTRAARKRHLERLIQKYDYEYDQEGNERWIAILNWKSHDRNDAEV